MLARNFLLDGLVSLLPRKRRRKEKGQVLLVRLDAIGDFVLWLDAAAALRSIYPASRYRLVLVGNSLWTDLAVGQPHFDEVFALDLKRLGADLRYRLCVWRTLRSRSWDAAINPTFSRHFPTDDAVIRVCGAEERIGFESDRSNQRPWELWISNRWYTRLIRGTPQPLMELERNAEFVRGLGLAGFSAAVPHLEVGVALPSQLAGCRYFVAVPGASLAIKRWPLEKFADVVRRIWKGYGLKVVLCGGAAERELGERLQEMVRSGGVEVVDLIGSTTLSEFAAIIKGASLVLANDSSAVHVAAAVGTKAICLAGGGHFGRFVPYLLQTPARAPLPATVFHRMECYYCNLHCTQSPTDVSAPCLELISTETVWQEVTALLSSDRQPA